MLPLMLTGLIVATAVTGCSYTDPREPALRSSIESNPSPDAIVGMWHWQNPEVSNVKYSILFASDGKILLKLPKYNTPFDGHYSYTGNGTWTAKFVYLPTKMMFQIASGKLIQTVEGGGTINTRVFERQ